MSALRTCRFKIILLNLVPFCFPVLVDENFAALQIQRYWFIAVYRLFQLSLFINTVSHFNIDDLSIK